MSQPADFQPPPPETAPQPADERLREQGLQLVTLFSAIIRIGRAYSVTNQVFRTQIEAVTAALRALQERASDVAMVAIENDIYVNGVRLPVSSSNFRFHQTVVELFRSRGVSGFRVTEGVSAEDLTRFFEIYLGSSGARGNDLVTACAEAGIRCLHPVVHASTVQESEGGEWHGEGEPPAGDAMGSSSSVTAGRRYHTHAMQGARSLLTTTTLTSGLEMRHAKRVVQPLVDGAFALEPVVVGLSTLREHDEFTYAHAVNVCAVAVTMGYFLAMDRRTLADIGVAALLHDVGKSAVSENILHPLEAFTDEERAAAERHPLEGAKILAKTTSLNSTTLRCMRVALEHHTAADGSGYPQLGPTWKASLLSQVVSLADCFVSLHTRRGDLIENITPYQALGMVLGPLRDRFEPALLWALVQSVGFYPPGQMVELDDGYVALVMAPNKDDLSRPHVRIVAGPDFKYLGADRVRELHPMPAETSVRRALRGEEYPTESDDSSMDSIDFTSEKVHDPDDDDLPIPRAYNLDEAEDLQAPRVYDLDDASEFAPPPLFDLDDSDELPTGRDSEDHGFPLAPEGYPDPEEPGGTAAA